MASDGEGSASSAGSDESQPLVTPCDGDDESDDGDGTATSIYATTDDDDDDDRASGDGTGRCCGFARQQCYLLRRRHLLPALGALVSAAAAVVAVVIVTAHAWRGTPTRSANSTNTTVASLRHDSQTNWRLTPGFGVVFLVLSAVCNGSFGVPLQIARAQHPKLRDEVFQLWWGCAAAAVQMCCVPLNCLLVDSGKSCFTIDLLGILAGCCVFCATVCVFRAVKEVGVALQPSLVAAAFVIFSLFFALVFLHDKVTNVAQLALATVLIIAGAMGVALSKQLSQRADVARRTATFHAVALSDSVDVADTDNHDAFNVGATLATVVSSKRGGTERRGQQQSMVRGFAAATGVGFFGGLVPFLAKLSATTGTSRLQEFESLPSVGLGLALATMAGIPLRLYVSHLAGLPRIPRRQCTAGRGLGLLSGMLWGSGNALLNLGLQSGVALPVSASIYQASLIVGGLWGVLWFAEIRGAVAVAGFFTSALFLVGGVVLMEGVLSPGE